jgi:Domain of unknown function (DUF4279)
VTQAKSVGHAYTVEFRIYGETLDPGTITIGLGLNPSHTAHAGTTRGPRVHRHSVWGYSGFEGGHLPDWDFLEEGLAFVLNRLWPHRQLIAEYKTQFQVAWWVGHFQSNFDGGPSLSSSLLLRLGEFGADVFIDNHFVDTNDPMEAESKGRP